jgi:putative FmdB family regulatory protein
LKLTGARIPDAGLSVNSSEAGAIRMRRDADMGRSKPVGLHSRDRLLMIGTKEVREVPTYDYRCTRCGDEFAVEQSILDKPLTRCRKCKGKLEKMLPKSLNLIFKGSGFYITDYKKPDKKGKRSTPVTPSETSAGKEAEKISAQTKPAEKKTGGETAT